MAIIWRRSGFGFSLRALGNGKIVVAGGTVEGAIMMFSRVADCESCPEMYVEYGDVLPASTYEIFDPAKQQSITSARSVALNGPLTILGDGRVAKLGAVIDLVKPAGGGNSSLNRSLLLELSNNSGTNWHSLSVPPALRSTSDAFGLRLASPKSAKGLLDSVLLIRIPNSEGNGDWWWIDVDTGTPNWQALDSPRKNSVAGVHGVNIGHLRVAGHTYTLVEDDEDIAAIAE